MDIKIKIKNAISKYNPLAIHRRKCMHRKLINREFSLLCPNCLGGMLLHDLGQPFLSPTVNLMLDQRSFIKFVLDLKYYLSQELEFYQKPGYACPCARLGKGDRAITIHFTHYADFKDAKENWCKRVPRIRYDNLFVVVMEKDGVTKEDILRLGTLDVRGLVVFTAHEYPDIPYTCYISEDKEKEAVSNMLVRSYIDDSKKYERYFDFVKWFNEASGKNYDCRSFCL